MNNIIPQEYDVTAEMRQKLKGHEAFVLWFTGLSGSGKSTLANLVEKNLFSQKIHTYTLDGDNIRGGLNNNLGFSEEDRTENQRRIAEVCKLFVDAGIIVIAAFIAPLERDREMMREIIGEEKFIEIFVDTSLEECERRDVKGLYKKARAGEIKNFTGINAPYEAPKNPNISIKTEELSINKAVNKIIDFINPKLRTEENE